MEKYYRLHNLLIELYGRQSAGTVLERLVSIMERHQPNIPARQGDLSQRDSCLITYPDQVREEGTPSLRVLAQFCKQHFASIISTIHILPFYPWTSDDGFAVADYRGVAVGYGSWDDIRMLGEEFRLMLDAVINHASVANAWFQGFLAGDPRYQDYFIVPPEGADLSRVVRPRALPLLTPFETSQGLRKVWTTFSTDQVDLNYRDPEVLLEMLDVLLFYAEQKADFLRLDAIAYLWKQYGTTCIHLPETHAIVKLLRAVLNEAAPHISLVTETNVPHLDNISYFGDGFDEARIVYNFPLPPLVLHAIQTGSAAALTRWANELLLPSSEITFLNFLASHDGIGLSPLHGILTDPEIEEVIERAKTHGALVSFKEAPGGKLQPYELNINYYDALNDAALDERLERQVERFLAAHGVLLAIPGIPAIYFHSLLGWRGWPEGVAESGRSRSINRQKFQRQELEAALADPRSQQAQVFGRLSRLLRVRAGHAAFHPYGSWKVITGPAAVFCILRVSPAGDERVLCLQNLSQQEQIVPPGALASLGRAEAGAVELITGRTVPLDQGLSMEGYQALWLE
jgi:sucrose phosphorylase